MPTKRLATEAEVEAAIQQTAAVWEVKGIEPSSAGFEQDVRDEIATAEAEGYTNETCSCGETYLAFHHFTRCRQEGCPINDGGPSLAERILGANADD